jgi:hypothetical protein
MGGQVNGSHGSQSSAFFIFFPEPSIFHYVYDVYVTCHDGPTTTPAATAAAATTTASAATTTTTTTLHTV